MTLRKLSGPGGSEVEVAMCNGYGCGLATPAPVGSPWLTLVTCGVGDNPPVTEHFHDGACLGVALAFRVVAVAQAATTDPEMAARFDRVATTLFDLQPGVEVIEVEGPNVEAVNYLIWSNKHGKWWKPAHRGYTSELDQAGAYRSDDAAQIALTAAQAGATGQGVVLVRDFRPQLAQLAHVRRLAEGGGPS